MSHAASDQPTAGETQTRGALAPPLVVRAAGLTDPGRVRPSNEDHFLIAVLSRSLRVEQTSLPQRGEYRGRNWSQVLLVADGVGGHAAGEVASALSVEAVEAFILDLLRRFSNLQAADEGGVVSDLRQAVLQADARIVEEAGHHPEFAGMGTTLTMAFTSGRRLFVIHAGDSRCYLLHGGALRQLTEDHTVAAELARRGMIRPEDVRRHQWRNVVTNVLGGKGAGVTVEVHRADVEPGDAVLLCTDGLTDMVDDGQIATALAGEAEPAAACRRLVDLANAAGGRDNVTVIVARFQAVL
jgi:protein phosphatase